jgi:hypothetical protein
MVWSGFGYLCGMSASKYHNQIVWVGISNVVGDVIDHVTVTAQRVNLSHLCIIRNAHLPCVSYEICLAWRFSSFTAFQLKTSKLSSWIFDKVTIIRHRSDLTVLFTFLVCIYIHFLCEFPGLEPKIWYFLKLFKQMWFPVLPTIIESSYKYKESWQLRVDFTVCDTKHMVLL